MRVRIYDTEGNLRYGQSRDDQRNEFIGKVYRNSKLRFLMDTTGGASHILCYVRAIENKGQRSEQFYVEMTVESGVNNLLSAFQEEAVKKLRKVFHKIDLSNSTTDVFEYLSEDLDASQYFSGRDLQATKSLAEEGNRLDFGAGDQRAALAVAKEMTDISAKVVIADSGRTEYYDDAEIVLDTGFDGQGVVPSQETSEKIEGYFERQAKTAAKRKIAAIGEQARELKKIKQNEGLKRLRGRRAAQRSPDEQFPRYIPNTSRC